MEYRFKIQPYQTNAVESVADVFRGQPYVRREEYRHDLGKKDHDLELTSTAYRNHELELDDAALLANIQMIQNRFNLPKDEKLVKAVLGKKRLSVPALDVEMETGTGKTYCYIKTMFELHARYGWSKFMVVVPGIAIREGVKKSFEMTVAHFMEHYGQKARFFVYDSHNLSLLDAYSSDSGLNVIIINMQAFSSSLKEGAKNKESRIIYDRRDEFGTRRPIDVIAANRPIVILDEPQKLRGNATLEGLAQFTPLFLLNYSATHADQHNVVYSLDALDAYNKKLVKKIQVKGVLANKLVGGSAYMYLSRILISANEQPLARLELEVMLGKTGIIRRKMMILQAGDDLFKASGDLMQYNKDFVITEVNPITNQVSLRNGVVLTVGETYGDQTEAGIRRVQIQETILSHLEKEAELFHKGIKTLSLFFIDEVKKYRDYDENGSPVPGEYARIFEEEYRNILNERADLFEDADYAAYLRRDPVEKIHNGYFSVDKKNGRCVNSETKRGSDISDDVSAYDLILKNKERLLNPDEPVRFIFSHSALREGWDNPNVFQICTLKHSDAIVARRQEVGRGLRLAVDKNGVRMDAETLGLEDVHRLNRLTVIANESYASFTEALQRETQETLRKRPKSLGTELLTGLTMTRMQEDGSFVKVVLEQREAERLHIWLQDHELVDRQDKPTEKMRERVQSGQLPPLPAQLAGLENSVLLLMKEATNGCDLSKWVENGSESQARENELNENFNKQEFKELWRRINHKYNYTVHFDSDELIEKAVAILNSNQFHVSGATYTVTQGDISSELLEKLGDFNDTTTKTRYLKSAGGNARYDVVGQIAKAAMLTRRTVVNILKRLKSDKLGLLAKNPEQFIRKASELIVQEKATMIVEHISYNRLDGEYDKNIFTVNVNSVTRERLYKAKKHIQPYVVVDGLVELNMAKEMDAANEVCVYAKLPAGKNGFQIPTPVGHYSPDWAIVFNSDDKVKHVFFIAETKGSMNTMQLRSVEAAKIQCATKLFNEISTEDVRYYQVTDYQTLLNIVQG